MNTHTYAGLDRFRMAAALMIVAIHTAPFAVIGEKTDFIITYCLFRVGVPFFLMVTGYFVLYAWQQGDKAKMKRYLSKVTGLYLLATVLYLPINLYAGKRVDGFGELLKTLLFDGTFYHLWYLPAAIVGCLVLMGLYVVWGLRGSGVIAFVLYVIGTLGDSYFGLVSRWEAGRSFYDSIFLISSYTRNGLFYAPVFLWLGLWLRGRAEQSEMQSAEWTGEQASALRKKMSLGLAVSLALLAIEGLITYENQWQKHNSMYVTLLPVMYFLFRLLLCVRGEGSRQLRSLSLWVYLIHPICIILVRGGAKVLGMTGLFVENSLVHFLAVCAVSVMGAWCMERGILYVRKKQSVDRTE